MSELSIPTPHLALRVEAAGDIDDCRKTVALQEETWGRDLVIPPSVLLSAVYEGGYLGLGYSGPNTSPSGFVFGFVGLDGGRLRHHSQRLAVDAAHRHTGLAVALKRAQREHCLRQGIATIGWTMDPLQPRNARFNFAKLGGHSHTYRQDFYGPMTDEVNAGLPTDRIYVEWDIMSRRAERRLKALDRIPQLEEAEDGATYLLRADGDRPGFRALESVDRMLLEIPVDIGEIKRESPELALSWRLAVREAFTSAFRTGYRAMELLRDVEGTRVAYLLVQSV